MPVPDPSEWPPLDAMSFVAGERFAALVMAVAGDLQRQYAGLDFIGATGLVWDWFARKARRSRRWFAAGRPPRFRTEAHFRAYLRQALWRTAANELRQERRRQGRLVPLSGALEPVAAASDPAAALDLRERAELLPVPLNLVVEALVFAERGVEEVARDLCVRPAKVVAMFEAAIDQLAKSFSRDVGMRRHVGQRRTARQRARLWQASGAGLAGAAITTCEGRYTSQGLTSIQAKLVCRIVEDEDDPIVVASALNLDVGELNQEYGRALSRLAGR